jgi:exosortase family protein XrtF
LKEYLIQFKPFLIFLAKFALTYLALTLIYGHYLSHFNKKKIEVDGFTRLVANQSLKVLSVFDSNSYTLPNLEEASVKMYYHNKWVSRIIEGCNGLSIIIFESHILYHITAHYFYYITFLVLTHFLLCLHFEI